MPPARPSRRFIEALKLHREPAYRIAWAAGVHPNTLSKLVTGQTRVRRCRRSSSVSVSVMAWVFNSAPTTSPTDQAVLLAIADRCDDEGTSAYPSVATIAKKTRLDERSVRRAIKRLQDLRVLTVDRA